MNDNPRTIRPMKCSGSDEHDEMQLVMKFGEVLESKSVRLYTHCSRMRRNSRYTRGGRTRSAIHVTTRIPIHVAVESTATYYYVRWNAWHVNYFVGLIRRPNFTGQFYTRVRR